jgi:hypothetical protein
MDYTFLNMVCQYNYKLVLACSVVPIPFSKRIFDDTGDYVYRYKIKDIDNWTYICYRKIIDSYITVIEL